MADQDFPDGEPAQREERQPIIRPNFSRKLYENKNALQSAAVAIGGGGKMGVCPGGYLPGRSV